MKGQGKETMYGHGREADREFSPSSGDPSLIASLPTAASAGAQSHLDPPQPTGMIFGAEGSHTGLISTRQAWHRGWNVFVTISEYVEEMGFHPYPKCFNQAENFVRKVMSGLRNYL